VKIVIVRSTYKTEQESMSACQRCALCWRMVESLAAWSLPGRRRSTRFGGPACMTLSPLGQVYTEEHAHARPATTAPTASRGQQSLPTTARPRICLCDLRKGDAAIYDAITEARAVTKCPLWVKRVCFVMSAVCPV
jgi:hypothetical protein